jgi:hypothetical protein
MASYPFQLEPLEDFDQLVDFDMTGGDDVWFARPQLFFTCSLCPTGRSQDKSSIPASIYEKLGVILVTKTPDCEGFSLLHMQNLPFPG